MPLADGGLYKGILIDLVKHVFQCRLHAGALQDLIARLPPQAFDLIRTTAACKAWERCVLRCATDRSLAWRQRR